jgi:hypothetical protein
MMIANSWEVGKPVKSNPADSTCLVSGYQERLFKLLIVLLTDQFVVRKAEDLPSS